MKTWASLRTQRFMGDVSSIAICQCGCSSCNKPRRRRHRRRRRRRRDSYEWPASGSGPCSGPSSTCTRPSSLAGTPHTGRSRRAGQGPCAGRRAAAAQGDARPRRLGSLVDAAQPRAAVIDPGSLAAPWGGGAPAWSWPWSGWPRPRGRLPRLRVAAAAPRRRTRSPRRRLRPLAAHETRRWRALTRVASPETLQERYIQTLGRVLIFNRTRISSLSRQDPDMRRIISAPVRRAQPRLSCLVASSLCARTAFSAPPVTSIAF